MGDTDTTTPGQSVPRSNGNEGILHISQSSWSGASLTDSLLSYVGDSLGEDSYPFVVM